MKRESLIALGVALVLGALAVYLANIFLSRSEVRTETAAMGTTRVAVAAVPLDYGVEVTPEKIRFVDLPNANLPAGSFRTINQLLPMGKKRVALRPIQVNELILASKLSGEGQSASIAALLPDGKRAAAIRLNDVSGVAGFIQPNDSVDVLVTRQAGVSGGAGQQTDVLLQNVRVIAIDQNAKNADGTPSIAKTATLEVQPVDAQKLALAQQVGSLSLVLRKPGEEQNSPLVQTVSLNDLRYSLSGGARYTGSGGGGFGQSLAAAFEPARARIAASAQPTTQRPVRRGASPVVRAPRKGNSNSVEIVRGTEGKDYEVNVYGS